MKNLTKKIETLSSKRTWIRESYKKFMEEWAENTQGKDVKIYSTILTQERHDENYYYKLVTGEKEIHFINHYDDLIEYSEKAWSWDALSIKDIKTLISNLPKAIAEIEKAIDQKTQEENNIVFPKY